VILRNGTIRTLDPSLPSVSALWIAGERIAGGVGVHETSLPTP
jgi:predicted amidohydrolase YtcJ